MAALATPEQIAAMKRSKLAEIDADTLVIETEKPSTSKQCFFYMLQMNSKSPCSYFTIGKAKNSIILEELIDRPECYHNEGVYTYLDKIGWAKWTKQGKWGNNYTSPSSREIFDCHFISYVLTCDGIEFDIEILFMSLRRGELLIPSVITSNNQIITIIFNHIKIVNNLLSQVYHNYRIELMCKAIANKSMLDLRYTGHPSCKTKLYTYQRDSIQWMINQENALPSVEFSQDNLKLFDLGSTLKLYFNYDQCINPDKCFIKYGDLPKVLVKGGIIADEVGLGKTVQALSLAISRTDIRTLIVVPNHLKEHWLREMTKHFTYGVFTGIVDIMTFDECNHTTDASMESYCGGRIIVDEIAELYATARAENHKLFNRLCGFDFQFCWGISATPFVDDCALFNIIKFLLGNNKLYRDKIGNYIMIQEAFKPFFRKNIKENVQADIQLPDVHIHNVGLDLSTHERAILDAIASDSHYSVEEQLRIISNAMLELSNNEKSVITVEELKRYTVARFLEKVAIAEEQVRSITTALQNITDKISEHKQQFVVLPGIDCQQNKNSMMEQQHNTIIKELEERKRHISAELAGAEQVLLRRKTVHNNYLKITDNISDIFQKNANTNVTEMADGTDADIDIDKMCPICYQAFTSDTIVLFVKCRHLFCQPCFEHCHKQRPNTCPMCRTIAEVGEINYIGLDNKMITCTKNSEILRLLNSKPTERFIIFTRFDKFIPPLVSFLSTNDINSLAFDEYRQAQPIIQDSCRVILLSSNTNASGTDMSYIHNAIIIEPFDNYIYGKEIEKQLIGRLHRINQTHAVDVYRLYIRNTIEEEIYALG